MSFEFLVVCLRDRAITARCREDYWALADMAHGAYLALDGALTPEQRAFLSEASDLAEKLAEETQ